MRFRSASDGIADRAITPCMILTLLITLMPAVAGGAGIPSTTLAAIAQSESLPHGTMVWGDYDGDGKQDFLLMSTEEGSVVSRVFRNVGGGEFLRATECTTQNGVTTCEGNQSAGIAISSDVPVELWVQNLTADINPAEGVHGIEVGVTAAGGVDGHEVTIQFLDADRAIVTEGDGAHGILASSTGGGGSRGANDSDFNPFTGGAWGGHGGAGRPGGDVTITNEGSITTNGAGSIGISAMSYGGRGGGGGMAEAIYKARGGRGGMGGVGGDVLIENRGTIVTEGDGSHGLFVLSQGGNGGNGGNAWAPDAVGGDGGGGGEGGRARVSNEGAISTSGAEAHGILGQSLGGIGGDGGNAGGIVGGGGGALPSGAGGVVDLENRGSIATTGDSSHGILAQSIGGFGASGGSGGGVVGFGGIGATGGNADSTLVDNSGSISTEGHDARGIFAQSVGGGGGSGSGSGGVVSLGGKGSAGGDGGFVGITNRGRIQTDGELADGIMAQSIGGGGGNGGGSGGLVSLGGDGSSTGHGSDITIVNEGMVLTEGDYSRGILAQSIGGGGGNGAGSGGLVSFGGKGSAGGSGADVSITNSGTIQTGGEFSDGILAQSIGGGGGSGGGSGGLVSFGGTGSGTSVGGDVTVTNTGSITTSGNSSHAIHAQSIGGGGGSGGSSGGVFSFGGAGGAGVDADTVTVIHGGDLHTMGDDASAIFAQSIGGGGGNGGGSAAVGAYISMAVGGSAGPGGDGEAVIITVGPGSIVTEGDRSSGIHAQSVGGGGGNGGFALSAAVGNEFSASVALGGSGREGGIGGDVEVTTETDIVTSGDQSHGILAESVGGGGGTGGFAAAIAASAGPSASLSIGGTGGAGGTAGNVDVSSSGNIDTSGHHSFGILAQSVGGGGGDGGGSLGGSFSGQFALTASFGGTGDRGGDGGDVTVSSAGQVTTSGDGSHAILAQSVGGGGGSGGFSAGISGSAESAAALSFGGSGGVGGVGGQVDVANAGLIATSGYRSNGILAQSVGGGGGDGGASIAGSASGKSALAASFGGAGNQGGSGGDVAVSNAGQVATEGDESHAIFAQSVGGGGGSGGFSAGLSGSSEYAGALSFGGSGGVGSVGGQVDVANAGLIGTSGYRSNGILAQSVGGGGGNGGGSIGGSASGKVSLAASFGGTGDRGGDGGDVTVSNAGQVVTECDESHAIFAQSVGGGGGSGGFSAGISASSESAAALSLGGSGGVGGVGGRVDVENSGLIATSGDRSNGIFAQSVGGGGGDGGLSIAGTAAGVGGDPDMDAALAASSGGAYSLSASIGGSGGTGGVADSVLVVNQGQIFTDGEESRGIFAQSVGGGGGNGATSVNVTGTADSYLSLGVGGTGGSGGVGGAVDVANEGSIQTLGQRSSAVLAQSVGGGGGNGGASFTIGGDIESHSLSVSVGGEGGTGGHGGSVGVDNSGEILTSGGESHGIHAQSVGAGGGNGGSSTNFPSLPSHKFPPEDRDSINLGISVGGSGGAAGDGGEVSVENTGQITTTGAISHGILAQSIGGGGGNGANGIIGTDGIPGVEDIPFIDDILTVWDPTAFGLATVGGSGGANGNGATVEVANDGAIATGGYSSHGIFGQSIGGGGGTAQNYAQGGDASVGLLGVFSLGGSGGASGDGGNVSISNEGSIYTEGDMAFGILAQSVGGGGGIAGDVSRGLADADLNFGAGWGFGGDGTDGGNGGDITISNTGDITTLGDGSIAIFAQSVGGGGGLGGGAGNFDEPIFRSFAGSTGGSGSGGAVTVDQTGNIATGGDASHGIFAQSAGGESGEVDAGGPVTVTVDGDILVYGEDSNGVMAQSVGSESNGDITIEIKGGTIQGGLGDGTAVLILDGATNSLTNHGSITTAGGPEGWAVRATSGDDAITNFGTISGSIDLGAGANEFINEVGALLEAGSIVNLGGGRLVNDGTFSPGGAAGTTTTTLSGTYEQTFQGVLEMTVCGLDRDLLLIADNGAAELSGTLRIVAECQAYLDGTVFEIVKAIGSAGITGEFDDVVMPDTAFLHFEMEYAEDGIRLEVEVTPFEVMADSPVERALAGVLDGSAGRAEGDMSVLIGAFQLATEDEVEDAFASLSPESYDDLSRGMLQGVRVHENALARRIVGARSVSWADFEEARTMDFGRSFDWWLSGARQNADQDANSSYQEQNYEITGILGGFEWLSGRALLGGSLGSTRTSMDLTSNMASGETNGIIGSLYGGHVWGPRFAHAIVSYSNGDIDNSRVISVGPLQRTATSSYGGSSFSTLVTGGTRFLLGSFGLDPFATLRYTWLNNDGFTEQGAGAASLAIEERSVNWLTSDLGARFTTRFTAGSGWFVPELIAAWNHDFAVDDGQINASFTGPNETPFTIEGQDIARDGFTLGLGIEYQTFGGHAINLRYDYQQRSDFQANGLSIRIGSGF